MVVEVAIDAAAALLRLGLDTLEMGSKLSSSRCVDGIFKSVAVMTVEDVHFQAASLGMNVQEWVQVARLREHNLGELRKNANELNGRDGVR